MLSKTEIEQVERACRAIGNEVGDSRGFVSLDKLLSRFNARLLLRPLLVEGMVAAVEQPRGEARNASQWAVLVDSESYPSISEADIPAETYGRPLHPRFRNTVAHELAHSLAYRPGEFGVQLDIAGRNDLARQEFVDAVERETERLSPMLLWADRAVHAFASGGPSLTLAELREVTSAFGISRHVLINRLADLRRVDSDIIRTKRLTNCAIVLGKWSETGALVLRNWPVFAAFERNLLPQFMLKLRREDSMPLSAILSPESLSRLTTGECATLVSQMATAQSVSPIQMTLSIWMERTNSREGAEGFLLIRGE
jgi:hypothetical protein